MDEVEAGLTSTQIEKFTEIYTVGDLKLQFKDAFPNFLAHQKTDFPELSERALKVLTHFVTTDLCEKSLSTLVYLQTK